LALDLSTTALETLQQTLGPTVLAAMPDAAFADAVLAMVLDAIVRSKNSKLSV
jgi:hypothetical protein